MFVSSHLMSEMALTADRLVVIGRGRLIADTTCGGSSSHSVRHRLGDGQKAPRRPRLRDALLRAGVDGDELFDGPGRFCGGRA